MGIRSFVIFALCSNLWIFIIHFHESFRFGPYSQIFKLSVPTSSNDVFFLYKVGINLCTAFWKLMCCPLDWYIIPQKHRANEYSKIRPGLAIEFSIEFSQASTSVKSHYSTNQEPIKMDRFGLQGFGKWVHVFASLVWQMSTHKIGLNMQIFSFVFLYQDLFKHCHYNPINSNS